jgi:Sulfotransferase family
MTGPAQSTRTPVRYVSMPGSPYTGSTLLGMLLANHPSCASIGAATGLTAKVDLDTYVCSCGTRFLDCGFWHRVADRTTEQGHPVTVFKKDYWNTHVRISNRRWLNGIVVSSLGNVALNAVRDATIGRTGLVRRRVAEARLASWSLARAVLDETNKPVFVDTARDHQRPRYLAGSPRLDVKVIHLVRDPRGNSASIMKHTGVDVTRAARRWRHANAEADRLRRAFPADAWMPLHYEELCAEPQGTLDRVARFIGIDPVPLSGYLQTTEQHVIGNSMRLSAVSEIREDRTWRETLSEGDLETIARVAGSASHHLGFDWP